jgi:hypothetical protein
VSLHAADAEDPDISSDLALLPDTETLADRPKPCLAEVQELPRDWARLFDGQLYCLGEHSSCWRQCLQQLNFPGQQLLKQGCLEDSTPD